MLCAVLSNAIMHGITVAAYTRFGSQCVGDWRLMKWSSRLSVYVGILIGTCTLAIVQRVYLSTRAQCWRWSWNEPNMKYRFFRLFIHLSASLCHRVFKCPKWIRSMALLGCLATTWLRQMRGIRFVRRCCTAKVYCVRSFHVLIIMIMSLLLLRLEGPHDRQCCSVILCVSLCVKMPHEHFDRWHKRLLSMRCLTMNRKRG